MLSILSLSEGVEKKTRRLKYHATCVRQSTAEANSKIGQTLFSSTPCCYENALTSALGNCSYPLATCDLIQ